MRPVDCVPSYDEIYTEAIEMLDKFPKLNIVFPHFFLSDNPKEAALIFLFPVPVTSIEVIESPKHANFKFE